MTSKGHSEILPEKNRNVSSNCLEKSIFLKPGSTIPQISNQIDAAACACTQTHELGHTEAEMYCNIDKEHINTQSGRSKTIRSRLVVVYSFYCNLVLATYMVMKSTRV